MELNDDININANAHIWRMLAGAGIDMDLVSVDPSGTDWDLTTGDTRIAFGPAIEDQDGTGDGWNWTRYVRDEGDWVDAGTDWAPDDAALLGVLAEFAAKPPAPAAEVAECVNCGWKADSGLSHDEYVLANRMTAWLCDLQDGTVLPPRSPSAEPVFDDNGTVIGYTAGA